MQKKTYQHKKRIVYTALSPFLRGEKLMKAMVLWEKKYANAPSLEVNHFVYDLKNSVDENADTRAAHLNLVKTANLPESQLLGDPSDIINEYITRKKIGKKTAYLLPELEALKLLIKLWETQLTPPDQKFVVRYTIDNITKQKINPTLQLYYLSWLTGREDGIRLPFVDMSDLRKIINLFYIGSCEYIGPVKTDAILNDVVMLFKQKYARLADILVGKLL